jgi:hypothetical protein
MESDIHRERVAACHWLLLRLAGTVPDDLTSQCRRWLAEGDTSAVGRAVAYAVLSQRVPLSEAEIDLLAELLGAAAVDTSALVMVDVLDTEPMPKYAFAPSLADVDCDSQFGAADARPGVPVIAAGPDDDVDRAILAGMDRMSTIRAVWRAWRFPGDGAPWPRPRRIYIIEVDRGVELAQIAAALEAVLTAAGESHPQVEVYPVHASLPSYQRLARAHGALIWTRDSDPGLRLAVVLDRAFDSGTGGHAMIGEPEATSLLDYLSRGEPLLITTARMRDVVDPAAGAVVPANFRTDGRWIWSDAASYYLERYSLAPDLELVAHIRRLDYTAPEVDGAAIHRALAMLQEPPADEPAWTFGG